MRRSLTGPLLLLIIGGLFLWRNLQPNAPLFEVVALYWPFALIAWGLLRLVESLIWRSRGYRGGFSGGEIALIVLITLFGAGISEAHQHGLNLRGPLRGLEIWGQQFDYPISERGPAARMKRVIFENRRGNIKVIGADVQEIVITGRKLVRANSRRDADRADRNTPVEILERGDHIVVRTNQDRAPNHQRISHDLEVVLPRDMAIESRATTGDYDVADLAGEVVLACDRSDVRLARLGGNVRLEIGRSDLIRAMDVKGSIDLQGQGSDIDLENVGGQVRVSGAYRGTLDFKNLAKPLVFEGARNTELQVQGVPGRISMDLGRFSALNVVGPVRLVTQSRDIKVEQFTNSLELRTERGDIVLTPGRLPLAAIDAKSGTGRIDLVLPPKAAFQLTATAEVGDVINDFGPQIEKEVSGRSASLKGKVGDGPTVRLRADRGWISVRREGSVSSLPDKSDAPRQPKGKGTEI